MSANPQNVNGPGSDPNDKDNKDPFCGANTVISEAGAKISDNRPYCFNSTNLHFHGFHVSPKVQLKEDGTMGPASDAVLLNLEPNKEQDYVVQLPKNHAPGTHWYHPHRHGSTAAQVSNALAGTMIIKEKPGQEVYKGAYETVWSIQELVEENPNQPDLTVYTKLGPLGFPENPEKGQADVFLVNGKKKPEMKMKANTVHRFRFVNATSTPRGFGLIRIQKTHDENGKLLGAQCLKLNDTGLVPDECMDLKGFPPMTMYLIAVDGITFYGETPEEITEISLAPGNRADVVLKLSKGKYQVVKAKMEGVNASSTRSIATINVGEGEKFLGPDKNAINDRFDTWKSEKIPLTGRPSYLKPITNKEIEDRDQEMKCRDQKVFFNVRNNRPRGPYTGAPDSGVAEGRVFSRTFTMGPTGKGRNLELYGNNSTLEANLGDVQEWTLKSEASNHPFHIHVNPFQVDISGKGDWVHQEKVCLNLKI